MVYGYIYVVENDINDKLYIGQTINPHVRWKAHMHKVLHTSVVNKAIKKYGVNHFDFVLLEACPSVEELNKREVYWIESLGTLAPDGYNLTRGGSSDIPGEVARRRMSVWQKGKRKWSSEQRKRISDFHKGKILSKKTREKMSENSLYRKKLFCVHGHPFTDENTAIFTRTDGRTYRRCRMCVRETNRRTYYRKKLKEREV